MQCGALHLRPTKDCVTDMGKFDSRNSKKMKRRKAQAKKKAREARKAEKSS